MSERTRHSEKFDSDGYRHLEVDTDDDHIGTFQPGRRLMGVVAASAAAGELVRRISDQLGADDRPEPPERRPDDEEDFEEPFAKAA